MDDDNIDNNCDGLGDNAAPLWATPTAVDPGDGLAADYRVIYGDRARLEPRHLRRRDRSTRRRRDRQRHQRRGRATGWW
ncbi:MAG: hypothetical protein IPI35_34830 [Deltaproteobacteria bacterium]|nr:hypothetical protein [Deltaproteobacteria bacterium]